MRRGVRRGLLIGAMCVAAAGAASASAAGWNAARWQAVFSQIPATPSTLAQAADMIGLVKDKNGHPALGPIGALARSRAAYHAGIVAMGNAAASSARGLQQKMASASQAERIRMAMQMSGAMQMSNPGAMRAFAGLETYVMGDGARTVAVALKNMRDSMTRVVAHYDACHATLDKQLVSALKACPAIKRCGDTTDCPPVPACVATIEARVPALIAQHRKFASAELAEERALFGKTRAALAPVVARTAALTAVAEKAGIGASQANVGYSAIQNDTALLQLWNAKIALRAGYWQGIQQKKVADDFFVVGNLGYRYPLGKDDVTAPPTDPPDGW
jgi:hypothetical protein